MMWITTDWFFFQCDPGIGVDRFFHALYSNKNILVLLGSGCSNVTERLANIVPYWNIPQVSIFFSPQIFQFHFYWKNCAWFFQRLKTPLKMKIQIVLRNSYEINRYHFEQFIYIQQIQKKCFFASIIDEKGNQFFWDRDALFQHYCHYIFDEKFRHMVNEYLSSYKKTIR